MRADYPRADNGWSARAEVRCVLKEGQLVRVGDAPIRVRRRYVWVPLTGADVTPGAAGR